jgi:hypothetical protein
MSDVATLRANGTELALITTPVQPSNAPEILARHLTRFGENYNTTRESHLYKFLTALCGDGGAGALKREYLTPILQQILDSTHFGDIDSLYGSALALPRLSPELYNFDPKNQSLTQGDWQEIRAKDASYRARCLIWMRALIEGPTPRGIGLAAKAATGVDCDVYERYVWTENQLSVNPNPDIPDLGQTNSSNEFIIVPRQPNTTEEDRRSIINLVDKLRPVNTIPTIYDGDYLHTERPVKDLASTSDRFDIVRYVTGRPEIDWPDIDPNLGYWVTSSEEIAPTFAYMDRQESATFPSIQSVTSSSEHTGPFNQEQSALFDYLGAITEDIYFNDERSYARAIAPVTVTSPWVASGRDPGNLLIVNNYYPIGYFSDPNIDIFTNVQEEFFWASLEEPAPAEEYLIFDIGSLRPLSAIECEISQKPIDIKVEYDNAGVWTEVTPVDFEQPTMSLHFVPSTTNDWHYFFLRFNLIETTKVRVTFTRRADRFPLPDSDLFAWSIEVRRLRLIHLIPSVDQFIPDAGTDILGNSYRTDISVFDVENVIDDEPDGFPTIWQSQPNPSRHAVEALYFDLRSGWNVGTMAYLERFRMGELDERSMADLENYFEDGVVIDEIFLDPVTIGPTFHIYYSLDTDPDWDEKTWIPIPKHYKLQKGFHSFPAPTYVKFIKIEFSDLTGAPYSPIENPIMPQIQWRKFPNYIENYFNNLYIIKPNPNIKILEPFIERVTIDPLKFTFTREPDSFDSSSYELMRSEGLKSKDAEVKTFIDEFITGQVTSQSGLESQIDLRTTMLWQSDLIFNLDQSRSLSRFVVESTVSDITDTGWNAEIALPTYTAPLVQDVVPQAFDRDDNAKPTMWFPQKGPHTYDIELTDRIYKIAYFVAIRKVSFHRRDYNVGFDEPIYYETLDDDSHIELNDFVKNDWRFEVTP